MPSLGLSGVREVSVLILQEAGHCLNGSSCRGVELMFTSPRANRLPRQRK